MSGPFMVIRESSRVSQVYHCLCDSLWSAQEDFGPCSSSVSHSRHFLLAWSGWAITRSKINTFENECTIVYGMVPRLPMPPPPDFCADSVDRVILCHFCQCQLLILLVDKFLCFFQDAHFFLMLCGFEDLCDEVRLISLFQLFSFTYCNKT